MDGIKEISNSTVNRTIGNHYYFRLTRGEPSGRVIKQKTAEHVLKRTCSAVFCFWL